MGTVTILSGPVGAGKTTIARHLVPLLPGPLSYIEGDTFWSFVAKSENRSRREDFQVILRAMTAASLPFARSGFDVLIDFSAPPQFLATARKILKEIPLHYVALRPSEAVCAERAATRLEGKIPDYSPYRSFYALFEAEERLLICDDQADAAALATRIRDGLTAGKFLVSG